MIFEKVFINQAKELLVGVFLMFILTNPQPDVKATLMLVLKAQKDFLLIISFIFCSILKMSSIMPLVN